jgi:hypothetical protein
MHQPAKIAVDRYLAELKQVLSAAPREAREDALRDAAEFLDNEVASPEVMHLTATEQQAYDYYVERYGSPSQVATGYLETQPTTPRAECSSNPWKYLAAALALMLVTTGVYYFETQELPLNFYMNDQKPPKASPFTQVVYEDDKVFVEYSSTRYEWLGIDDIPVTKISEFSQNQFRDLWQKRITEDLVEVLWGMGHFPGETVKLRLRNLREDVQLTIVDAPMTHENRQSMYGNYIVSVVSPKE